MTTTQTKRIGRPPLPPAPPNAADCRGLIAVEIVKTKPRERTLRHLHRLLQAFERADTQAVAEEANALQHTKNELIRAEFALFVLSEIARHYTLIEPLSDSRLRDLRGILEETGDPKQSVQKCGILAARLVDDIETNNAPDADGSAIRRLRELESVIAQRQKSGVKSATRGSGECPTS